MASSGNFCTLNPLVGVGAGSGRVNTGTMSNGNLKYEDSGSTGDAFVANMAMTGKTYCEVRIDSIGNYGGVIGLRSTGAYAQTYDSVTFQTNYSSGLLYHYKGTSDQSASGNVGGTVSAGNIVMFAYDPATYKWWVGVNGTWRNSGDPANGSGEIFTGSATMFETMDITWGGWVGDVNGLDTTWNFGQDSTFGGQETAGGNADDNGFGDFKYSPPTGFLALCTGNLSVSDDIDPAQTDDDYPGKQFNAVTYTGTGSNGNNVTGLGFEPDLVWFKNRSNGGGAYKNNLADTTRGVTKVLYSDADSAEDTNGDITSFDSDGFTVGGSGTYVNASSQNYVAWCWRANGGTTASNTDGSITSTVQANTKAGFSIITYTGTGSNATIGHGLSSAPDFFIVKDRGRSGESWNSYHTSLGATKYLVLNTNAAPATNSNRWNNTEPTSTTIGLGTNDNTNGSSTYLCYAWHAVEGYSKFGTYEGNGNSDGPFIYMGFRPRMVVIKAIDSNQAWYVADTARETYNPLGEKMLSWNDSHAEFDPSGFNFDVVSNGIKIRSSDTNINSSATFIYMAWGDVPFKYNNTF